MNVITYRGGGVEAGGEEVVVGGGDFGVPRQRAVWVKG